MTARLPLALAALPALAVARLLPEDGAGLYLRLAAATVVALLPGILVARALGQRSASAALLWALAALFLAMTVTFALSASITATLVLLALIGAGAAVPVLLRGPRRRLERAWSAVLAAGTLFGIALWRVTENIGGDGLFHLGRVRRLAAFDDLSLHAVNEFADGGLHPGYAFPLWHGFLAVVSHLAGVDPAQVVLHGASVLAPLVFLVVFEAGTALFASVWAGLAVLAGHVAFFSLAPGHGGAFPALALPATSSRQLVLPAVLALLFGFVRRGDVRLLGPLAAGGLALTLIHPSYSPFLALPLAGFVAVRLLFDRREAVRAAAALGAFLLPSVLAILWLLPIVRETASHAPDAAELERAFAQYEGQLEVAGDGRYRLAPELLSRSGAVAVAALALLPLAGIAARRRWAAFVLGGSLAVLLVVLVPELFMRLSDAFSISQSRRLAGFLPFAFVFAAGAVVLARLAGLLALPLALAAGIALQAAYPGDFSPRLEAGGGPAGVVFFALAGAAAALFAGAAVRSDFRPLRREWLAAAAAGLFVLPVAWHAARTWTPSEARRPNPLTPALMEALRENVPERAVVFSDLETSYRVGAFAPVYVAAGPPAHVADTEQNRPYERRQDVIAFFATGDLEIPRRYGADYLIVDGQRFEEVRPDLPVVHEDERYTLYRLDG
jgi:hypothetical protein